MYTTVFYSISELINHSVLLIFTMVRFKNTIVSRNITPVSYSTEVYYSIFHVGMVNLMFFRAHSCFAVKL